MRQLQAGFARADVTPMMGIGISGYYVPRNARRVLDALEVCALALACGEERAVLLSIDNCGLAPTSTFDACRQRIAEALGTTTEYLLSSGETLVVEAHERGGARAARDINELVGEVTGMFAGGKLSDDALDGAMRALNEAYWIAKDKNKKYGRKKKKDAEEA